MLVAIIAQSLLEGVDIIMASHGAKTAVHTHPGAEAFYVLECRLSQRTPHGVNQVDVGQFVPGHGSDTTMEVYSSGTSDLNALVLFVVDATKPFSSPAKFE